MDDRNLSGTQRLIRRLSSPELFAAMERDSRLWKGECPHCRAQTSLWEIGGVRYKAIGEPLTRLRCAKCGQMGWMRIRWTGGDPTALGPRPSVWPMMTKVIVITTIAILLLVAVILFAVFKLTGLI